MKSKKIWAVILMLLVSCSASFGWVMTQEFSGEIAQKEAASAKNPSSADAHFDMAITYAYTNKIQEGLDELKKTGALAGDRQGYARKIIERYYAAVKKNPSDWRARFRLAFAYYFGGYRDYSIQEMQNIANIDPTTPWPWGYMAIIYAEENKWDKAIESMKKAISIDSNVAAFHLGLGQGYYKINRPAAGFSESFEALRLKA
ncbi:MAG: tetratricopeptide repeat protein, partial [Candidatus Margulisiibacteriota bacterium]